MTRNLLISRLIRRRTRYGTSIGMDRETAAMAAVSAVENDMGRIRAAVDAVKEAGAVTANFDRELKQPRRRRAG